MPRDNGQDSYLDPYADMCLSAFPGHPHSPIYMVVLPKGQKLIFLGTTHTMPLGCFLPYKIAHQIIEASQYVINEIEGELLGKSYKEEYTYAFQKAFNGQNPEYLDILYVTKAGKEKMVSDLINEYVNSHSMGMIPATCAVNKQIREIFDENNCWYHHIGSVIESDDILEDSAVSALEEGNLDLNIPGLSYKYVKIGNVIYSVPTYEGKDLTPDVFAYLVSTDLMLGNWYAPQIQFFDYIAPDVGGVDNHLSSMRNDRAKILFSLEEKCDRFILEDFQDLQVNFEDTTIIKKEDVDDYYWNISGGYLSAFEEAATMLYSEEQMLPSTTVLRRNSLWVERLMTLNDKSFKQGFVFVGEGHLSDLFEKLSNEGCTVSELLSIAELENFLLDEKNVLNEHEQRKIAMQQAFGHYLKSS